MSETHARPSLSVHHVNQLMRGVCTCTSVPKMHTSKVSDAAGDLLSQKHAPDIECLMRKALRKVTCVLGPLMFLACTFGLLDKSNLAFAALELNDRLGFSPEEYGLASGLSFASFTLALLPSTYMTMWLGGRCWLGFLCVCWGAISASQAAVTSKAAFYACRLLLGASEAGAAPSAVHILAQFYPKSHHAKVFSLISTASATIGYIIAAPLAAGLMSIKGSGSMAGWQWLFIIEGVPSVLLGVAIMLWLPNEPLTAWMLHLEERQLLHDEVQRENASSRVSDHHTTRAVPEPPQRTVAASTDTSQSAAPSLVPVAPKQLLRVTRQTLSSVPVLICLTMGLFWTLTAIGLSSWLPIITLDIITNNPGLRDTLTRHGLSPIAAANLLTAVPYIAATVLCLLLACSSKRLNEQTLHVAVPMLVAGVSLICYGPLSRYELGGFAAMTVALALLDGCAGVMMARYVNFIDVTRVGIAIACFNMLMGFGGFFGPFMIGAIFQKVGGSYAVAATVLGAFSLAAGTLVLLLAVWEKRNIRQQREQEEEDLEVKVQNCELEEHHMKSHLGSDASNAVKSNDQQKLRMGHLHQELVKLAVKVESQRDSTAKSRLPSNEV